MTHAYLSNNCNYFCAIVLLVLCPIVLLATVSARSSLVSPADTLLYTHVLLMFYIRANEKNK